MSLRSEYEAAKRAYHTKGRALALATRTANRAGSTLPSLREFRGGGKIRFDTTDYVFSHGRQPRGRGSWAFSTNRNPSQDDPSGEIYWTPSVTYIEAKKLAKKHFSRVGHDGVVFALP